MIEKLYYKDPYIKEFMANVVTIEDSKCLLDSTAFYPGGGGQPADTGKLIINRIEYLVTGINVDEDDNMWHITDREISGTGQVQGILDWENRYVYMRYHGLLHIVNAVAMRDYQGWITGVQIGTDYARIDFNLTNFTKDMIPAFEDAINFVINKGYAISAQFITEAEYDSRPELIRTLTAKPPIKNGVIRITTICDFDAQACGGTHVSSTKEIGPCHIEKMDNKGAKNKRFYFKLLNK